MIVGNIIGGNAPSVEVTGDKHYIYNQSPASAVWTVSHGLGKYPSVTVIDSAGTEVVGDVVHIDANTTEITFCAAFSGKAYFN